MDNMVVMLDVDGKVYTYDGSVVTANTFDEPIVKISVGKNHALALSKSKKVYGWGSNEFKQLEDSNNVYLSTPVLITTLNTSGHLENVLDDVVATENGTLFLTIGGSVYVKGSAPIVDGSFGGQSSSFIKLDSLQPIQALYGSKDALVAKTLQNDFYAWGNNTNGKLFVTGVAVITTPRKMELPVSHSEFDNAYILGKADATQMCVDKVVDIVKNIPVEKIKDVVVTQEVIQNIPVETIQNVEVIKQVLISNASSTLLLEKLKSMNTQDVVDIIASLPALFVDAVKSKLGGKPVANTPTTTEAPAAKSVTISGGSMDMLLLGLVGLLMYRRKK